MGVRGYGESGVELDKNMGAQGPHIVVGLEGDRSI